MKNKKSKLTLLDEILLKTSIEEKYKELLRQTAIVADYQERIAELEFQKVYCYAKKLLDKNLISMKDYNAILEIKE